VNLATPCGMYMVWETKDNESLRGVQHTCHCIVAKRLEIPRFCVV
jgi:hypothetical protein